MLTRREIDIGHKREPGLLVLHQRWLYQHPPSLHLNQRNSLIFSERVQVAYELQGHAYGRETVPHEAFLDGVKSLYVSFFRTGSMPDSTLVDDKFSFASSTHIVDSRILRALEDLGFARPTLVQSKAVPLALEGRDILARARTGSGKTAAYCIPVIQNILSAKYVSFENRACE